jgi:phage regulator Rha-like protein
MQLQIIQNKIYEIRGQKVMLDFDLAILYETETKRLKEAIRRNIDRFPSDFMFEITKSEFEILRTQIATSKRGGVRYLPFAFTEQGVAMLSSVLNSSKAIQINMQIVRAFVFVRQYALSHQDLTERLTEFEGRYDQKFDDVYEALNYLLEKDTLTTEQKERQRIGYKL